MIDDLSVVLLAGGITFFLLLRFRSIAVRIGLVDFPGDRKSHDAPVPVIGGVCMVMGFLLALSVSTVAISGYKWALFSTAIIVIVGVLDDFNDISPAKKFLSQLVVAAIIVLAGKQSIHSLGEILFIAQPYGLGLLAYPFSILAFIGVMNAFNMIDGHDGLAGGVSILGLGSLGVLCALGGDLETVKILAILMSTVLAFLLVNLSWLGKNRQVFMGDAGSLFIGLLVAFFAVAMVRSEPSLLKATAAPWIVGIPLLDLFSVMILRGVNRRSIFSADRLHVHHFLSSLGWGKYKTLGGLLLIQSVFCSIGIMGTIHRWNDGILFWGLFLTLGAYLWVRKRLLERESIAL